MDPNPGSHSLLSVPACGAEAGDKRISDGRKSLNDLLLSMPDRRIAAKCTIPVPICTGINDSTGTVPVLPAPSTNISTPVSTGDKNLVLFIVDPLKVLPNDGSDADMWDHDSLHLSSDGSKALARVVYESLQAHKA